MLHTPLSRALVTHPCNTPFSPRPSSYFPFSLVSYLRLILPFPRAPSLVSFPLVSFCLFFSPPSLVSFLLVSFLRFLVSHFLQAIDWYTCKHVSGPSMQKYHTLWLLSRVKKTLISPEVFYRFLMWLCSRHCPRCASFGAPCQCILSTHPVNTPCQYSLSTHPVNAYYQHTLSMQPINTPCQYNLSNETHPINTHKILFYTHGPYATYSRVLYYISPSPPLLFPLPLPLLCLLERLTPPPPIMWIRVPYYISPSPPLLFPLPLPPPSMFIRAPHYLWQRYSKPKQGWWTAGGLILTMFISQVSHPLWQHTHNLNTHS